MTSPAVVFIPGRDPQKYIDDSHCGYMRAHGYAAVRAGYDVHIPSLPLRYTLKTRRRIASIFLPRTRVVASWSAPSRLPLVVNGAGDAIAGFFAYYLRTAEIGEAPSRVSSAIFDVLAKTVEAGGQEVQLIAVQDEIVHPNRPFEARNLGR